MFLGWLEGTTVWPGSLRAGIARREARGSAGIDCQAADGKRVVAGRGGGGGEFFVEWGHGADVRGEDEHRYAGRGAVYAGSGVSESFVELVPPPAR